MPPKTPQRPAVRLAEPSRQPAQPRVYRQQETRAHNTTERVADVTRRLLEGEHLSAQQIAADYGITKQGARALLGRLSGVLKLAYCRPVWYRMDGGTWEPWN